MLNIIKLIFEFYKEINEWSAKPALSPNEVSEQNENIQEFESNIEQTLDSLKKLKNFGPNNIEKMGDFFYQSITELDNLEWLAGQISILGRQLRRNYIPPTIEAQKKYKMAFSSITNEIEDSNKALEPLYYCKIREEIINLDKDILFLIPISDGYIVNDEFQGLVVFNKDLSVRKIIHVGEGFLLDRRFMYKKLSSDEFIFYYFNFIFTEQYNIWYVNITTGEYKPIRYMGELNEFFPQKTYYWKDDLLFLINFTGQFYVIDHHQGVLTEISEEYVQKNHPDFHNYAIDSLYYDVIRAYPQTYSFIFRDKESKEIGLRNSKDDTTKIMKFFDPEVHDIRLHKEYFLFVQKKQIEIRKNKIKRVVIPAPSHYDFYDALCLEENGKFFILALAGFYKIPRSNSLILYEIVETVKSIELELC